MVELVFDTAAREYYLHNRQQYAEPFRLRIHRALSWLKKAASSAEDWDIQFITLWIAFNAAYAKETEYGNSSPDREGFRQFIQAVCHLDSEHKIYHLVWNTFSGSLKSLLDNPYAFKAFWDYHNGSISELAWQEQFSSARKKAYAALASKDTDTVLAIVFDRLYTIRNQLIHGGATYGSSVNRQQLKSGCAILGTCIPAILMIMQQHHSHNAWGQPFYPVVKDNS